MIVGIKSYLEGPFHLGKKMKETDVQGSEEPDPQCWLEMYWNQRMSEVGNGQ